MRRIAQVIGWSVTGFLFLASLINLNYGKLVVGDVLVLVSFGITLAGCIVSRWQEWLAGILFILTAVTLVTSVFVYRYYPWYKGVGVVLVVAGVLFLLSWWLSEKARSSV